MIQPKRTLTKPIVPKRTAPAVNPFIRPQNTAPAPAPAPVAPAPAPAPIQPNYTQEIAAMMSRMPNPNVQQSSMNMPPVPQRPQGVSYEQAKERVSEQVNPLYDDRLNQDLRMMEQDAVRRGFFGQLPTEAIKARAVEQGANQRAAAIAGLANNAVTASEEKADRAHQQNLAQRNTDVGFMLQLRQMDEQRQQANFENSMGIMKLMEAKKDSAWNRLHLDRVFQSDNEYKKAQLKYAEAGITGFYDGKPTAAYQQFMKELGLKERELSMRREDMDNAIKFGWEKLERDTKLAWANYNLSASELAFRKSQASKSGGSGGGSGGYEAYENALHSESHKDALKAAGDWQQHLPARFKSYDYETNAYTDKDYKQAVDIAKREWGRTYDQFYSSFLQVYTGAQAPGTVAQPTGPRPTTGRGNLLNTIISKR